MKTFAIDCSKYIPIRDEWGRSWPSSIILEGYFCWRKSGKNSLPPRTASWNANFTRNPRIYSLKGKIRVKCYLLRFFSTTAMIVRLFVQADFPEHDESTDWFDVVNGIVEAILFYEGFFFFAKHFQFANHRNSIYIPFLLRCLTCAVILEFYLFELEIFLNISFILLSNKFGAAFFK